MDVSLLQNNIFCDIGNLPNLFTNKYKTYSSIVWSKHLTTEIPLLFLYKTYSSIVWSKHLTTEIPLLFLYPSFISIFS